jgi:hypothetical protein
MAEKIDGEGGGCVGEGGREAGGGRLLPSVFDGLPAGPLDMAALEEAMQADMEARAMACLGRVSARARTEAVPPASAADTSTKAEGG